MGAKTPAQHEEENDQRRGDCENRPNQRRRAIRSGEAEGVGVDCKYDRGTLGIARVVGCGDCGGRNPQAF